MAPPTFIDDSVSVTEDVKRGPSWLARGAFVAAAVAVAGGGAFAVTRALSEPAGPDTPEEAINQLFEAVNNDDMVGVTEVMLPSERESILEPSIDLFGELQRLEIIDAEVDVDGRDDPNDPGLDIVVDGVQYVTNPIGQGVTMVEMTAGTVSVEGTVDDLPWGSRLDSELSAEDRAEPIDEEMVNFADEDVSFAIVEEDGSWYVSLWYSVAEAARTDAGAPVPAFGQGVQPVGGATPEEAVRLLFDEAVDLDAEGAISALDPSEFRALYDYAPLFLDDADEAAANVRSEAAQQNVTWSLDRLDLHNETVNGRTVVVFDGMAASATEGANRFAVDVTDDCATVTTPDSTETVCNDEIEQELDDAGFGTAFAELFDRTSTGFTVVERDGRWYVSGMPTILGIYTDFLAALEPSDIDDLEQMFDDMLDLSTGGLSSFSSIDSGSQQFEPVDDVIGSDDDFEMTEDFEDEEFDFEESEDWEVPEVPAEAQALMLPELDVFAWEPDTAYFADLVGVVERWYVSGYGLDGGVEVIAFDLAADELIAGMDADGTYQRIEFEWLPEGAVAYEWPEVDVVVVVDSFMVSAWYDDDGSLDLLQRQVQAIAATR